METKMWVASDGSWGTGDFYVVDVSDWSDADWDDFEDSTEDDRIHVAMELGEKHVG